MGRIVVFRVYMQRIILTVEDNEINRAILRETLTPEYDVLEAENGKEALDILAANADKVSLILLDVMMPVMDGYTFLDHLKNDQRLSLIPVIVMTQSDAEADEIAALSHGATDFVPKPYRPEVILHRVKSIINLRETAAMINELQYDRLTGVYNHEYFYQMVKKRLAEDPDGEYSIVCSNIDNFKLVNDTFGNKAGDELLKEIASISKLTVGDTGFCGRFGADRFLCFQKTDIEHNDRNDFGLRLDFEMSSILKSITMHWGIYEIKDRSIPVEQMCDRALLAVNSIKGKYNQLFKIYDDSLRDNLIFENTITQDLDKSLKDENFIIYYQPKYSLKDNGITGAEALIRWNHPVFGMMNPGEFIPLFEKNGHIPKLDIYVWEHVLMNMNKWRKNGIEILPVSVNVSRADMFHFDVVKVLKELTCKYKIEPEYLHLEITESAYTESSLMIVEAVDKLREAGFVVEMDDFGSGYSSLNMLSRMRLDILKLDLEFTQSETAKKEEDSILEDIIVMAHKMHLKIMAEGVENESQLQRLKKAGCDYVQGYYLAKPMCEDEYLKLLTHTKET